MKVSWEIYIMIRWQQYGQARAMSDFVELRQSSVRYVQLQGIEQ